jgi:hypothetical protein
VKKNERKRESRKAKRIAFPMKKLERISSFLLVITDQFAQRLAVWARGNQFARKYWTVCAAQILTSFDGQRERQKI